MKTLEGKTALITGGNRGLGKDAALRLAEQGANIVITYKNRAESADQTCSELAELNVKAASLQLDLSSSDQIEQFKQSFSAQLANWNVTSFDILINNAGVTSESPFGHISENELDLLYETNYKSLVLLTQALEPLLSDGGRIITMGTGLTRVTFSPMVIYAAMKSAVEVFTRYLANDLGKRGITVNAVSPGGIDNEFNAARLEKMPQMREFIASNTALGRMGKTEDIGGVVAFLCSDAARWISGQRIEVSGGYKL